MRSCGFSFGGRGYRDRAPQQHLRPLGGHSRTGGLRPHLVIGPAVTGEEIEVMFVVEPPETVVIFHVMQVRPKIMRIALRER